MQKLLLCVLIVVPQVASATVFWDDELEAGNSGYSLPGGAMTFDSSVKVSGTGSLRYDFPSSCYPDSNAQMNCGGFTDRSFTPTASFYRRFYVRLSAGFTVSDVFTKLIRSDTNGSNSNWWVMGCCGSKQFLVSAQNVPSAGNSVNYYTSFSFEDARWYCVETFEQLNTPGVANGISQAWVDGNQVMLQTGVMYRQAGDTSLYQNNRLYRQTGMGSIWFDRLAVGDQRIGCGDLPPPVEPPAPVCGDGICDVSESCSSCVSDCGGCPVVGKPGPVTDLEAALVGINTVELTFTEVDDGTGAPAKYDIRLASPVMNWGTASSVSGGCAPPLLGAQIGQTKTCTVTGLAANTPYQFELVSYRGTLNQDAVFGVLSNVASVTTLAESNPPPPAGDSDPPGGSADTDSPLPSDDGAPVVSGDTDKIGQGNLACQDSGDKQLCSGDLTISGCTAVGPELLAAVACLLFFCRKKARPC